MPSPKNKNLFVNTFLSCPCNASIVHLDCIVLGFFRAAQKPDWVELTNDCARTCKSSTGIIKTKLKDVQSASTNLIKCQQKPGTFLNHCSRNTSMHKSGPRYLHSNPTRGSTDRLCLLSTQDISKFWPLQSNQWNAKIWLTTKWWFFYKKISLNPPISLQKTAKKLSVDDLSPFRSVMETAIPTQKSPWKWLSHPENRFWHRFYHGFGSETKKPLKMIFAPWKSFLVPFLPWLWLRNKKALENDFRTLKIVWGTISTMALVSKHRSPWKWFSHPENRFWHRFYHGLPRNFKKDWTRTGSNRFAQRTEPNRTVATWNRTEPIHFTNRTADIPVSQNRNEPNRTGGFLSAAASAVPHLDPKSNELLRAPKMTSPESRLT